MKLKNWLHGLGAAFIGGSSSAVSVMIVDPLQFNIHEGWKHLLEVCLVSGVITASAYLKQSPLPPDDDDEPPRDKFTAAGGLALALCLLFLMNGCATPTPSPSPTPIEDNAKSAAQWVQERSGFIENAVSAITQVAVYSSEKDSAERQRTLEILHAVASNVNALVANGNVDPDAVKEALKINEPYFGPLLAGVSNLVQIEIGNFKDNGYADVTVAVLVAVSKGISDGTTTN